jgi:hypothetical protein
MKFFVFYSNRCNTCQKLLKTIQDEQQASNCQLVSFETNANKIPPFIEYVPAIVAQNLSKPLFGEDAIQWVENKKYFDQTTNNINKNNVINPNIKSSLDDLSYNKKESLSISDHYTTINDANLAKTMLDFDKIEINAPITNDVSNKKISEIKIGNSAQKQKMDELIILRKQQLIAKMSGTSKL